MKRDPVILSILSFSILVLVSCNLINVLGSAPTPTRAASPTAQATGQLATMLPQPSQTASNIPTLQVVVTPEVSLLPSSTPGAPDAAQPCNKAAFVAEVKTPDGSVFQPGDAVVKTWRLMNEGSCTWTTSYRLVFNRGYNFVGAKTINLARTVAPGESADLSLRFSAPDTEGTYVGFWNLQDPAGNTFGTGVTGDVPLSIRIVVK